MQLKFETFYIEPVQIRDAWGICDFIVSNEDRLKRYFPKTLEQNLTPDLSKRFVELKIKQYQSNEEFLFILKENQTKQIIGLLYIKELDWTKKQGELAYCIGYTYEGKGYTSKAVNAISDYAFKELKLNTLQIIAHHTHYGSVKIAENCNFIWRKTLINEFTPTNEKPLNMELYELSYEK